MKKVLIGIIAVLALMLWGMNQKLRELQTNYELALANVKAYDSKLDNSNRKAMSLQLTVEQMEYSRDSLLQVLDKTRKELKVKDKNLRVLQHVGTTFTKKDTIHFRDTLFKSPEIKLDTLIKDEWYSLKVGLEYPSTVSVVPSFKSDKHIVVSMKKETVNPPKKFFLFRWFQKRHSVLHVDVLENNPYIQEQKSTYVEIVK